MILLALALWMTACEPASTPVSTPSQITEPTSKPSHTATVQTQASPAPSRDGELTYEEMRSRTPPAPLDFHLTVQEESVRLDWTLPHPVDIPHDYSDVIIHYNIYRRTEDQAGAYLLATSEDLFYVDESLEHGMVYYYSVSAVHDGPLEGERTNEFSATLP